MSGVLEQLEGNAASVVWWEPAGGWRQTSPTAVDGLLCGAFNPLHDGHRALRAAASRLGGVVAYELTAVNADKPPLERTEIERRCVQFADDSRESGLVAVTNAATFVEKSQLFPQTTFVVGADTALRIVDRRFYAGDATKMQRGLATISGRGCQFLVAARWWQGRLLTRDDVEIPREFRSLFEEISPEEFRLDISSSELRRPE